MCMKCVATSSLAQMTSLGAGKRASASLEKGFPGGSRYWNFRLMIQMHAYIHTEAGKMRLNQDLPKEIENNDAPQEQKKRGTRCAVSGSKSALENMNLLLIK